MAKWGGMQYFRGNDEGIRKQPDRDIEAAVDIDQSEHVHVRQFTASPRSKGYQLYCHMSGQASSLVYALLIVEHCKSLN